jgi:molybdopterin-synthase adenylyltransferase
MIIKSQDYFSRQVAIPGIGREGLHKLQSSSVAIVGVGGVGSSAAYYLAKSGVGRLRLIDQDVVESTNLARLHFATSEDLFHPKVEVLANGLSKLNEWCRIEPVIETLTSRNADELLGNVDLIFDGLDNFRTRYILNKWAAKSGTRYLFTSAVADQAHLALLNPPKTACLECVMPHVADRFEDSCETLGVSPSILGLTGALGTGVAVRSLLAHDSNWDDHFVTVDMTGPEFLVTKLSKRQNCEGCGSSHNSKSEPARAVTLLCGEHTANVLPPENVTLELKKVGSKIPAEKVLLSTTSVLVYRHKAFTVSLFRNGRFLIEGVENENQASSTAKEIAQYLGMRTPLNA